MGDLVASTALYAGGLVALLGALSVARPLRLIGIPDRRAGLALLAAGAVLAVGTALFPTGLAGGADGGATPADRLDEFMPAYHFSEHHETLVHASADQVYRAIQEVRPGEVRFLQVLTGIRGLAPGRLIGRGVPPLESQPPILRIAQGGGFLLLDEEPGREIVLGTCGRFWLLRGRAPCPGVKNAADLRSFREPGYAKAVINFHVSPEGASCRVSTDTRILATDDGARRRFAAYWRAIYPGSALIRIGWLEAIRRRAEGAVSG